MKKPKPSLFTSVPVSSVVWQYTLYDFYKEYGRNPKAEDKDKIISILLLKYYEVMQDKNKTLSYQHKFIQESIKNTPTKKEIEASIPIEKYGKAE